MVAGITYGGTTLLSPLAEHRAWIRANLTLARVFALIT